MSCSAEKPELPAEIACPASKRYTHRAVFMGALSEQSTIKNMLDSADTRATVDACAAFGAQIKKGGSTITVINPITFGGNRSNDVGNSGTTIRIAAGIAALSSSVTTLSGDKSIRKRPMQPILDALEAIGEGVHRLAEGRRLRSKEGFPAGRPQFRETSQVSLSPRCLSVHR